MNDKPQIRILVADDHEMVRHGLTIFLRAFPDFELVGEAANGVEAVDRCGQLNPDIVLMDVQMPEMDGITATRLIREKHPGSQVLALSTFKDKDAVREMLRAGAVGYLLKNTSIEEMANAIRTALTGKMTLSPEAARTLIESSSLPHRPYQTLSEREHEVLILMVDGLNNVEIAEKLMIARSTVKFHVSSILSKLGASSRVEAVRVALQSGLLNR